jgi:hypothetical protein
VGGIDQLSGKEILFDGHKMDYTKGQMRKFVKMWEDGEPLSRIAEYFGIPMLDATLLVIHSGEKEYIFPRKGGYKGTKKHKWKREREKMTIE